KTPQGNLVIETPLVINAGGLAAAALSNAALGGRRYEHRFCRGRYFTLRSHSPYRFQRLIYPLAENDGLGVHFTPDLGGNVRLGPDTDWCSTADPAALGALYDCDWEA